MQEIKLSTIGAYLGGYDTRQDYADTLGAAAFIAGFLAFLINVKWASLPHEPSDMLSGEQMPLLLAVLSMGGAVVFALAAALVRRARDAGFPVAAGPALLALMPPLLYRAFLDPPADRTAVVAVYAVLLLVVMLFLLLAIALAIIDELDVREHVDLYQPSLPNIPRTGFSAMGKASAKP